MSQIARKFIRDNAVNGAKIRLDNNQALRARNAANSADVDLLSLSATDVFTLLRELSAGNNKIINVQDPTAAQDVATKSYVDAVLGGVSDPKDACRVATDVALPASTYNNGTGGVGATLTANANGALPSIDGVGLSLNDRVLVKDQVAELQNGIYRVSDLGSVSTPWVLTRTTDADDSPDGEVSKGMFTVITQGTVNAQQGYLLTTLDPITIGTTGLNFVKFGEVVIAGAGLEKTGSTLSVDAGDGLEFSGNTLLVNVDGAALSLASTKLLAGEVVSLKAFKESFTLSSTDITNQYVDITKVAHQGSVRLVPAEGPEQRESADYTLNYTGGTGSKTRVTFAGDLATGGNAALVAGDIIVVKFLSLDYT